jgi:hypothetical protein
VRNELVDIFDELDDRHAQQPTAARTAALVPFWFDRNIIEVETRCSRSNVGQVDRFDHEVLKCAE